MQHRLESITEKKLVGLPMRMSLASNNATQLWRTFMPRRHEIVGRTTTDLLSMQVYDADFHIATHTPDTMFTKWAAAEVQDFDTIPNGMQTFLLPPGLYAVFQHQGGPATGAKAFGYIFNSWLPASGFVLDNRPHFELLGAKYKGNDPDSEEEIWIPVKPLPSS